jgi:hypothetical protein
MNTTLLSTAQTAKLGLLGTVGGTFSFGSVNGVLMGSDVIY